MDLQRPWRVLIFEPYPMGSGGGNLRTLFYILKYLDRCRFSVVIVTPMASPFLDGLRSDGVEVVVLPPPPSIAGYAGQVLRRGWGGRLASVLGIMRYNVQMARFIRRESVDLVYCNSIRALLTVGLGAKLTWRPVLWYVKGELANAMLDRFGFVIADRILFFCAANRDDQYPNAVRWFRRKLGVLRIGIDPDIVAETERRDHAALAQELGLDADRLNIAILGQVYRPKGVHVVLDRLRELVAVHDDVMLWIVGDHVLEEYRAYRDDLEAIVARDGLADHVRFTGWGRDALDVLALMDIVAHPSLSEGFGRAVLEAMALGKPVVVSRLGGLREIVRDGQNGFLCPPGDSGAFLDRLTRLAGDAALRARCGREARREVFRGYLIEDKMIELQRIWAELIERTA